MVKSIPAIGARKIPAIPAGCAASHQCHQHPGGKSESLPHVGAYRGACVDYRPSAPTDPPKPIVMEEAISDAYMLRFFNRDFLREMA